MSSKPPYRVNLEDVPLIEIKPVHKENTARFIAKAIYGTEASVMIATRDPDYHTRPHYHDAEQINYILEGEIWFYVDGRGYRCRKGDFMRIPRDKLHWAWNRSSGQAVVLEVHSPPLLGQKELDELGVGLLGPDDDPGSIRKIANLWDRALDPEEVRRIEAAAWEEEGREAAE